jgi:hypothetical protein
LLFGSALLDRVRGPNTCRRALYFAFATSSDQEDG